MLTIAGEGQTAATQLVSMEGGLADQLPGELCDISAQHLLKFDTLNPYTYYQKMMIVKNKANVEVPFNWVVVKPLLKPPDPEADVEEGMDGVKEKAVQERVHDVDAAFSVEPQAGSLPPNGSTQFAVTFAPPKVCQV